MAVKNLKKQYAASITLTYGVQHKEKAVCLEARLKTQYQSVYPLVYPWAPQRRKDLAPFEAKSLIHMVGVKGFEPSTPCTPCKCATRLRHTPNTLDYSVLNVPHRPRMTQ